MGFFGGLLKTTSEITLTPSPSSIIKKITNDAQNLTQTSSITIPQNQINQRNIISGTVISGVLVYITGQLIMKFIIEPVHDQKKVIGEIADAIIFYGNKYYFPSYPVSAVGAVDLTSYYKKAKDEKRVGDGIRKLGSLLIAKTHMIPFYKQLATIRIVKPMKNIVKAKKALIGLSNLVGSPDRKIQIKFENEIREALGIFDPES